MGGARLLQVGTRQRRVLVDSDDERGLEPPSCPKPQAIAQGAVNPSQLDRGKDDKLKKDTIICRNSEGLKKRMRVSRTQEESLHGK